MLGGTAGGTIDYYMYRQEEKKSLDGEAVPVITVSGNSMGEDVKNLSLFAQAHDLAGGFSVVHVVFLR